MAEEQPWQAGSDGQALISVVVPVYNVGEYLATCLDSVLAQTHRNFQLVIVDDGSTDGSGQVCDEYAQRDARIQVVHQPNGGLSCARNTGLACAEGEYVSFLDSDDMLAPHCLELLLRAAEVSRAPLSACEYQVIGPGDGLDCGKLGGYQVVSGVEAAKLVVGKGKTSMITANGKLYRKDLWHLLNYPVGKVNEDEFVTYKAMYEAGHVALVQAALYGYVQRPGSIMSNLGLRSLDALEGLRGAVDYFEERGEHDLACWARKRYAFHIMACYYRISISKESSPEVLADLRTLFREFMAAHGEEVLARADGLLRIQLAVFAKSPALYTKMAAIYFRLH